MRALDALVHHLFDYSGMFPPASKPFAEALRCASDHPHTLRRPDLVGADMVLAISLLADLSTEALGPLAFSHSRPMRVCTLGREVRDSPEILVEDAETIRGLFSAPSPALSVTTPSSIETRWFASLDTLEAALSQCLDTCGSLVDRIFIEPDLSTPQWEHTLHECCKAISVWRGRVGLKVRGTGPHAIGTERLAAVVALAADMRLHLKATGGMHHPIIESRYGNNLGFLNLAAALALRHQYGAKMSEASIRTLLDANDVSYLKADLLEWDSLRVSADAIRHARSVAHFSIGSCSLDEPDEDLARLFGPPGSGSRTSA